MDAAGPLLAVDDEHAGGTDHQVIGIRVRVAHGQVVEHHVALAGEPVQQAGGVALAGGAALPGAGLLGEAEPQPPADQRRDRQAKQPGLWQAELGGERQRQAPTATVAMGAAQGRPWRSGCRSWWIG